MSTTTINILDDDGNLKESICDLINAIFDQFDVDKDGVLNATELEAFAVKLNGKSFSDNELQEIKDYFDVDDNGDIKKSGFFQMYSLQSSAEPEETIKDLEKLGYDLTKYV